MNLFGKRILAITSNRQYINKTTLKRCYQSTLLKSQDDNIGQKKADLMLPYSKNTLDKLYKKVQKYEQYQLIPSLNNIIKLIHLASLSKVDDEELESLRVKSLWFIKELIKKKENKIGNQIIKNVLEYNKKSKIDIDILMFYQNFKNQIHFEDKEIELFFLKLMTQSKQTSLKEQFYQQIALKYPYKNSIQITNIILINLNSNPNLCIQLFCKLLFYPINLNQQTQFNELFKTMVLHFIKLEDKKYLFQFYNSLKLNGLKYSTNLNIMADKLQLLYKGIIQHQIKTDFNNIEYIHNFIKTNDELGWPNISNKLKITIINEYFKSLRINNLQVQHIHIKLYKILQNNRLDFNLLNTYLYNLILCYQFDYAEKVWKSYYNIKNETILLTMLYGCKNNYLNQQRLYTYLEYIKQHNVILESKGITLLLQCFINNQQYELALNYLLKYNNNIDDKLKSVINKLLLNLNREQVILINNKFNLMDNSLNPFQLSHKLSLALKYEDLKLAQSTITHIINNSIHLDLHLINKLNLLTLKLTTLSSWLKNNYPELYNTIN